ncbi:MAG: alpha/beta hydrolase [Ferrimicrobium sp.]
MTQPWQIEMKGRWVQHEIHSEALIDNTLGDPADRPLWVYLPPSYKLDKRRYPTIYLLQGLTGQVDMWWNRTALRPTVPELVDTLFATDGAAQALVVLVDAWTSLGGSQFVNSPGTGRYLDYLCDDVVPFVDNQYRTVASQGGRALAGKSSGGYGAMVVPMLRPGIFGGLATHAGDAAFQWCYTQDITATVRALREEYNGSFSRFWVDFRSRPAMSKPSDITLLNTYCMAACYSAEVDGSVSLPFDPETGLLNETVWARWLELDPVRMAQSHAEELRALRAVWIDAGRRDQYFLDVGANAFSSQLTSIGVEHHFELFEGTHSAIEYRYPLAIAYLADRLQSD